MRRQSLEVIEDVSTPVTEAVDGLVVEIAILRLLFEDAGWGTAFDQRLAQLVGAVAAICNQGPWLGDRVEHERGASVVAHLTFAQQHDEPID